MLQVTDLAVENIKRVLKDEGTEDQPIRLIALPNGVGGVNYLISSGEDHQPDDTMLDYSGVKIVVDSDSAPFVEKTTIDYIEEFQRSGFLITNPDFPSGGGGGCGGGCACGAGGCGSGGCGSH